MIKEIKFTDKALKQIQNLLSKKDKGSFFRIAIKGGGCSGFQYEFTFDKSKQNDDLNYQNILIDTYNDHRMAMAFAPLGLRVPININNPKVVSKSYPDFWDDLQKIGFNQNII